MLTDPQYRALRIVALNGPIRPSEFADRMWPDSPAHQRSYNCGPYGSTRGRGLVLSAGSYLGKLRARGWIRDKYNPTLKRSDGYFLTKEGRQVYKEEFQRRRPKS